MISYLVGLVGTVISLIGWFGFRSIAALIIGTCLYVVETIMEIKSLQPNALWFELGIFVVGCIVGSALKLPFYVGGMLAINIYSAIITLIGIPNFIREMAKIIKFMKR